MPKVKQTTSQTTIKMAAHAEKTGVNLSALAANTGIKYRYIYDSLGLLIRAIKSDEALIICDQQGWDPRMFTPERKNGGAS